MTPQPQPRLSSVELVALALARDGEIEGRVGDAIPQAVWTRLYERNLIRVCRDACDETFTMTTKEGDEALFAELEVISHVF